MADSTAAMTYIQKVFPNVDITTCPFTESEILELETTNELLVHLPAGTTAAELCDIANIKANIDFRNEHLIKNVMINEDQWFIASASQTPELLYRSGTTSARTYEDEGLHGMDLRRYLAFVAVYAARFDQLPDQVYWTFLLSGKYDRSGVSIVGFDSHSVLNHHGWMRNFKAKFAGSRYVVLPPRIEVTAETGTLSRAYRGRVSSLGREADLDR